MSRKHRASRKDSPNKKAVAAPGVCNKCGNKKVWIHNNKCTKCKQGAD